MAGSLRDQLTATAAHLKKEGQHEYANAVESVLAPGGWEKLRKATASGSSRPLSISMDAELKKALEDAAEEFGVSLNLLTDEAYRKVLAGEWLPPKTGQRPLKEKKILNVSVSTELFDQVQEMLAPLSKEHKRRISNAAIVVRWACAELGVDTGTGLMVPMLLPTPLRDHFQAAQDAGTSLEEIVAEGVGDLMAGSLKMLAPSRMRKGTWGDAGWEKFSVRVSDLDRRDLQELAEQFSEATKTRLTPATIMRQILIERLGEPAA